MTTANNLASLGSTGVTTGFKNRIINGAMQIDQRNAGASVNSSASGTFSVDRFTSYGSGGGVYTTQQSSDVPTGAGFVNSIVSTVTTIDSPTGVDYYLIQQGIEGYNAADLQWGTASAKTITLSFWVKSSITGTYTTSVRNSALDRSYRATYTINSANTWEQKSVTIAGDTSGTWLKTNGMGISVGFALGAGSTLTDTGNTWTSGQAYAATGQTQWISTNGATFYLTGVQLEVGSTATNFDYRPYGTELALCQRYYWQRNSEATYAAIASGGMNSTIQARVSLNYPMPMRATPTISITNVTNLIVNQAGDLIPSALSAAYPNSTGALLDITVSGGTLGRGCTLIFGTTAASIQGSSEL